MKRSLTRREQTLFIGCTVAVSISIYYWALIVPLQGKRNSIREEITIYRKQIGKDTEAIQKAKTFAGRYLAYRSRFSPRENEEEFSSVFSGMEEMASRFGVRITDVRPKNDERTSYGHRFSAEVTMVGDLPGIAHYLYTGQQSPHYFIVDEADFEKSTADESDLITTRFVLSKIFFDPDGSDRIKVPTEDGSSPKEVTVFAQKPFEAYAQSIRLRDLFVRRDAVAGPDNKALRAVFPALHQRIKLVGILLDKDSQAIVEDLQRREVHFLSKGDHVGEILLEDIREDKAVFLYNNERIEMRL